MKNYLKILTVIMIVIIMTMGLDVFAVDTNGGSTINIVVPIHKTDSNKKPLEGATFTLKDLYNNGVSYSSVDKKDGDYLIEITGVTNTAPSGGTIKREDDDSELRTIDDIVGNDVFKETLKLLPTKYSNIIVNAETVEDLRRIFDLPLVALSDADVFFYVPVKIEETTVPRGYKARNIVIPVFVYLSYYGGVSYSYMAYTPGYYNHGPFGFLGGIPIYFEYNEETDYEAIFDRINSSISGTTTEEAFYKLFEDNGAIINRECLQVTSPEVAGKRENIEARFENEILENLCPIELVDERADIIINPSTVGTFGILMLFSLISFGIVFRIKKVKNN